MWDTWFLEDVVSRDEYLAGLETLDYPLETVSRQLTLLEKRKTPPVEPPPSDLTEERDLLQSEALKAYREHIIDEAKLRERLADLNRTPDAIDILVAIEKASATVESRDVPLGLLETAYRRGVIERPSSLS